MREDLVCVPASICSFASGTVRHHINVALSLPPDCWSLPGGDQAAFAGGLKINDIIASSPPLMSLSSTLAKSGNRFPLSVLSGPGPDGHTPARVHLGVVEWYPDVVTTFHSNDFFNQTEPQMLYHEPDHNYYFVVWPNAAPASISATLAAPSPNPAFSVLFDTHQEMHHIMIHNDLVHAFGSDSVATYEALEEVMHNPHTAPLYPSKDVASANAQATIAPSWQLSPPPAGDTCAN